MVWLTLRMVCLVGQCFLTGLEGMVWCLLGGVCGVVGVLRTVIHSSNRGGGCVWCCRGMLVSPTVGVGGAGGLQSGSG